VPSKNTSHAKGGVTGTGNGKKHTKYVFLCKNRAKSPVLGPFLEISLALARFGGGPNGKKIRFRGT
jgi:hypothetical protein